MVLLCCDALLLGEGMNMFWSFAAISPSTTRRIFFRGRGLLRVSCCRRLQVRKEEGYGWLRAQGSSSLIQAATEMVCIEGGEKWRGTGWLDVESMLFWWSGLRLTRRGNRRLVVALCVRSADPPTLQAPGEEHPSLQPKPP
jgi:hypothetical protein